MADNPTPGKKKSRAEERMIEEVDHKVARKINAREGKDRSIWFGLGMFGLVGWSVAIPTLKGPIRSILRRPVERPAPPILFAFR